MAAIVDMALPLARGETPQGAPALTSSSLGPRLVSAAVMAPVAVAAAWFGPPYLSLLAVAAGAVMGWEWARLCGRGAVRRDGALVVLAIVLAVSCAAANAPAIGLAAGALGAIAVALLGQGRDERWLAAAGVVWIALPAISLIWLAQDPTSGRSTVMWILAVIWATDIGAYAVGRAVGGPRLAPRMSPNKTWSGLLGGILCATLAGAVTALVLGRPVLSSLPLLSGLLAVVEQIGDLAESVAKRHFGVKDASGLIPGHGGLLDRLDGLLAVVPVVALLRIVGGESVLNWR